MSGAITGTCLSGTVSVGQRMSESSEQGICCRLRRRNRRTWQPMACPGAMAPVLTEDHCRVMVSALGSPERSINGKKYGQTNLSV